LECYIKLRGSRIAFDFDRGTRIVWTDIRIPIFILGKQKILLSVFCLLMYGDDVLNMMMP
jgi:hypothetical protein